MDLNNQKMTNHPPSPVTLKQSYITIIQLSGTNSTSTTIQITKTKETIVNFIVQYLKSKSIRLEKQ